MGIAETEGDVSFDAVYRVRWLEQLISGLFGMD